jgi:hypothetical protein
MCSALSSWRLYSCRRLTITSNIELGSLQRPSAVDRLCQHDLVLVLYLAPRLAEVGGRRAARACAGAPGRCSQPSPIVSVIRLVRRGLAICTKRRGETPLVLLLNFSGHSAWKSCSTRLCQQAGVQLGHAVDGEAADRGQVGHAHHAARPFFDDRHARPPARDRWESAAHFFAGSGS